MRISFGILLLLFCGINLQAQQRQGDKWVDNGLVLQITEDQIREKGIFTYCIADSARGLCIENLSTGVEVKVYDAAEREIWKGIGSGRMKRLSLSRAYPEASYIIIKAFKPFVTNVSSGNRIHQDSALELKYMLK